MILDREGITRLIPHSGSMCLLDQLHSWSQTTIHCAALNHNDARHPLRTVSGLLAPCAIEYAAQAMALHGALLAPKDGPPAPGYLASVRSVQMRVERLDGIDGALQIHAQRTAGNADQILYQFSVNDDSGRALVEGRATVVLNTPLPS